MASTSIEWSDETWNPTTGCTKTSPGCARCYAETMSHRLQAMGQPKYTNGFQLAVHEDELQRPASWRKPRRVFVNSMSDLFHRDVPFAFIERVFRVMEENPAHTFQVLTKRAERLAELAPDLPWPDHVWMGVSVENQRYANERIPHLLTVPARVRFLSCEPLLGDVNLLCVRNGHLQMDVLQGRQCVIGSHIDIEEDPCPVIHWVIAGGESGHKARPINPHWVRHLRNQCRMTQTPFFFKQWGAWRPATTSDNLQGKSWKQVAHINHEGKRKNPREAHTDTDAIVVCEGKKKTGRILDGVEWMEFPR